MIPTNEHRTIACTLQRRNATSRVVVVPNVARDRLPKRCAKRGELSLSGSLVVAASRAWGQATRRAPAPWRARLRVRAPAALSGTSSSAQACRRPLRASAAQRLAASAACVRLLVWPMNGLRWCSQLPIFQLQLTAYAALAAACSLRQARLQVRQPLPQSTEWCRRRCWERREKGLVCAAAAVESMGRTGLTEGTDKYTR